MQPFTTVSQLAFVLLLDCLLSTLCCADHVRFCKALKCLTNAYWKVKSLATEAHSYLITISCTQTFLKSKLVIGTHWRCLFKVLQPDLLQHLHENNWKKSFTHSRNATSPGVLGIQYPKTTSSINHPRATCPLVVVVDYPKGAPFRTVEQPLRFTTVSTLSTTLVK